MASLPDVSSSVVAQAQAGDRAALESLLRASYEQVYVLCRRMTGSDSDAADATQEALIAITRGLPRFDGRSSFRTWAYRVATNACLDELRRRRRRPEPVEQLPDPDDPGTDRPAQIIERLDLDRALLRVPDDFRAALVLRDLCDLDYAEIGRILQIPPGTVRSRIARGRSVLARILAGNPGTDTSRPTD